ncbi:hypothetical protein EYF80_027059 [Liparis tanakae]|uniref:Uncharacterized protein n=1 Tax=Liparis tanakae TaxID=230148 RepID=A0A4Z2H9Z9_9TELE|nr:hypothetical protein EYF80_027059 [Liparis tanakae]
MKLKSQSAVTKRVIQPCRETKPPPDEEGPSYGYTSAFVNAFSLSGYALPPSDCDHCFGLQGPDGQGSRSCAMD